MFSIQLEMDSAAAEARLENMISQIEQTATQTMPIEFVEWQEKDMNRDRPNIEIQGWSVMTRIWPRSRLSMVARKRPKFERPRVSLGLRPILRRELFDMLVDRMHQMLITSLNWRKTDPS